MMKKLLCLSVFMCFVLNTIFSTHFAQAEGIPVNLESCDYDDIRIGSTHDFVIKGNKYEIDIESGGDGFIIKGTVNDPMYTQIKYAKDNPFYGPEVSKEIKDQKMAEGDVALFTSMDKPICASPYIIDKLIFGIHVEKNDSYIIEACLPETSDCRKLKIRKSSNLGLKVKRNNGRLEEEGKECFIYYLPNKEVITIFSTKQ